MIHSNYPTGAEHDSRAPYNTPDMDAWTQATEDQITQEALIFLADNCAELIYQNQTLDFIIEQAVNEGLSLCDKNTQEMFNQWAHNDLTEFLLNEVENKLYKLRF
jgi:hypothetical protein